MLITSEVRSWDAAAALLAYLSIILHIVTLPTAWNFNKWRDQHDRVDHKIEVSVSTWSLVARNGNQHLGQQVPLNKEDPWPLCDFTKLS
ncbi:uncharacterized protein BDV14DRAFT_179991 [Aspergillus stella-maris]|uniref:uncharacterized protein n=1 Tax=Aspergillus stella-maris TaxID=1810926 RepID=UPI003CCCE162